MKISHPSTLQKFLSENDIHAHKQSSQNFLIDSNIVRKIIELAEVKEQDLIVEIGPGPGALTEGLLETGCQVIAVEKDRKLAHLLERFQLSSRRLTIYAEDFLELDLEEILKKERKPGQKIKVVANLPYHITTPILAKLVPMHSFLSDIVVMIQKEVADRLVAEKGTKDYSSFTVFLQFYTSIFYGFTVDANCFYPKPSVQSAVVRLCPKLPPEIPEPECFFALVRKAFQQRRKMIRSSLKTAYPLEKIEEACALLHIDPQIRPEQISLEQWITLYLHLR